MNNIYINISYLCWQNIFHSNIFCLLSQTQNGKHLSYLHFHFDCRIPLFLSPIYSYISFTYFDQTRKNFHGMLVEDFFVSFCLCTLATRTLRARLGCWWHRYVAAHLSDGFWQFMSVHKCLCFNISSSYRERISVFVSKSTFFLLWCVWKVFDISKVFGLYFDASLFVYSFVNLLRKCRSFYRW